MCSAGFAHTGLTHGLSRMTGNCHVRFLGEGAAAMPLPYPTRMDGKRKTPGTMGGCSAGRARAPFPAKRQVGYGESMERRRIPTQAAVFVWLLCAVLTCLAVDSPHCDRCDGPILAFSLSQSQASHQQTIPPDTCNGICWCCGFHGLPNPLPALALTSKVTISAWPDPSSPLLALRLAIFRPPRIATSA